MANLDRIREVVALIEEDEQQHDGSHFDMVAWVDPPDDPKVPAFCNTTMCFAGWVNIHEVGGMDKFLQLAVEIVEDEDGEEWATTHWSEFIEYRATHYLGITSSQAHEFFYRTFISNVAQLKQHVTNVLGEVIWEGISPSPQYRNGMRYPI